VQVEVETKQPANVPKSQKLCCLSLITATGGTLDKLTGRNGVCACQLGSTCLSWVGYPPFPKDTPTTDHVRLFWLSNDGLECAGVRCDDRLLASRDQHLLPRNSSEGHFQYPQRRARHLRGRSTQQSGKQRPANISAMLYFKSGLFLCRNFSSFSTHCS